MFAGYNSRQIPGATERLYTAFSCQNSRCRASQVRCCLYFRADLLDVIFEVANLPEIVSLPC